jgi:hypothetical protein
MVKHELLLYAYSFYSSVMNNKQIALRTHDKVTKSPRIDTA